MAAGVAVKFQRQSPSFHALSVVVTAPSAPLVTVLTSDQAVVLA
ncbi:hypothetical protein SMICM304S_09813 [Streptomyces microflavus]